MLNNSSFAVTFKEAIAFNTSQIAVDLLPLVARNCQIHIMLLIRMNVLLCDELYCSSMQGLFEKILPCDAFKDTLDLVGQTVLYCLVLLGGKTKKGTLREGEMRN